ncbi:hypothetical protein D8T26_00390 [Vibrio vulnificus]|uniref:hypothetical protein n=1 Tax=Vibrio TaxID=662 RepID=UPI00102A9382|nr:MULTISPECIES: hypothetical protein [Vibrio]EGQ7995878.1 hypothetical protein [Vibrio vulnificus]EHH0683755.1 hypothetical protein [Vibrio vulnificus]EIV8616052.1 hypothetical protein [Vibrio vulnificus]MCU8516260.1 hypothetical protein [Vibrio vulnificus]MDC8110024.1 hypothetical protein [Vibrio sp. CCUG 15886]
MKNGFIYPLFDAVVRFCYYCNLVELFKFLAKLSLGILKKGDVSVADTIKACNVAIDIYQIFKWFILLSLWYLGIDSKAALLVTYYLLASNLFTYFYYHVWGSRYTQRIDRETLNRKFLNAMLAISYYLACYAYLYHVHFSNEIKWPGDLVDSTNAIYLSIANAFTLTYGGFSPETQEIRVVFMSQLINTFLFFTIIISNSIPNHAEKE